MTLFKLRQPVGTDYNVEPHDTVNIKRALNHLGYYPQLPDGGFGDWVDHEMFDGIRKFQSDNGLKVDGFMRPGGETETVINHALSRGNVRGARSRGNAERLFGLFDRFSAPGFHDYGSEESYKCCATGTCENLT